MTADRLTDPVRAAVLLDHPAQYVSPALRRLAGHGGIRPRVYYWTAPSGPVFDPGFDRPVQWRTDLYSGYEWWAPDPRWGPLRRRAAILGELRRDRPQVFLSFGWASPVVQTGLLFATLTGTPLFFICDANGRAVEPPVGLRQRVRRRVRRALLRRGTGAVCTGVANRLFYLDAGLPPDRLHPGVLPADVDLFTAAAGRRPIGPGRADRPVVIGFVGKLQDLKCVDHLIEACASLADDPRWQLWLVGDGPARSGLESLTRERGLTDRVSFLGFRNTDEVPELMAAMDIVVLPSRQEARGLVAIEGMAAGAAVVVSSATGVWGAGDAVEHGVTGLVFTAGDVPALAAHLRGLLDDPARRARLATNGRQRATLFGPDEFARTTASALLSTTGRTLSPTG